MDNKELFHEEYQFVEVHDIISVTSVDASHLRYLEGGICF